MKPLTRPTIFLCSSSASSSFSCVSQTFSIYSYYLLFHSRDSEEILKRTTSLSGASPFSSSSRRHHGGEESRNVKVSVWWDFENCSVPSGVNPFKVTQRIHSALRANEINGPVTITAVGDVLQLSKSNQEALSSTGICLNHIPRGGKNSADRSLLFDVVCWASRNPPPAHLFLISGDRDFANILHQLRMNNYNILLASNKSAPSVLCSAASIMWQWNSLVRGEDLSGRHFNQPPDGLRGWYGYFEGHLEDPFSDTEHLDSSQPEDSQEPGLDSKPRSVPKFIVNIISQIVNSHAKGINIIELRSELARNNITMDKDFFGYRKFSRLLLALPIGLKLRISDGQILVHGIQPKTVVPVKFNVRSSSDSESNNGDGTGCAVSESNIKHNVVSANTKGNSPLSEAPPPKENPPPVAMKESDTQTTGGHSTPLEQHDADNELGVFQKIRKNWFGSYSTGSNEKDNNLAKCSVSDGSLEETKSSKVSVESQSHHSNSSNSSSFSSSNMESSSEEKVAHDSKKGDNISEPSLGFLKRIKNWFRSWRSNKRPDIEIGQCDKAVNQIDSQIAKHELFSRETFWDEMESFLCTPRALVLISQSKTREQFAQELQKEGPPVLKTLGVNDLLQLVDVLISEKRWVEECCSKPFPYKPNFPSTKLSTSSNPCGSNALSSIFSRTLPDLQRQPDNKKGGNGDQKHYQIGAVSAENKRKSSSKSRSKIFADCEKLVAETVKFHPDGFNMGAFKSLFLERYGYSLDHNMLGFQKLTALLQTMPGIKIESTYILPAEYTAPSPRWETDLPYTQEENNPGKAGSDSELSDSARKDNDSDSPWEELGPVSKLNSKTNASTSGTHEKAKEEMKCPPNSDSYLSESEFSDSDGESPVKGRSEEELEKLRRNDEDSSLLQILDSWYGSKDEKGSRFQAHKVDGVVDCSRNDQKPKAGVDNTSLASISSMRKMKPSKTYSFVSDTEVDEKEKLIDSILGSLKKSGESRMQS